MKKNRFFVFVLMALILALALAGCRKADPKALAKETYDLIVGAMANPLKAVGSIAKAASLGKKVSKLSDADKQIYNDELARLTGSDAGGIGILDGLLGGKEGEASGLLGGLLGGKESGASGLLGGLLGGKEGEASGILGGLMGADSAAVNEALKAIMEAMGALNSTGTEATQ
jgi:hypothetical protein